MSEVWLEGVASEGESWVMPLFDALLTQEIKCAASFHGDIGEGKKTLDKMGASEQVSTWAS